MVRLRLVPVGGGVALDVGDEVEVPAPCLGLGAAGEACSGGISGLARVVAEDRNGPDRVGALGARTGEFVQAEGVGGAVAGDDLPVLTLAVSLATDDAVAVVAVVGAGLVGDPGGVVVLQVPDTLGVVLDEFGGLAVEDEGGVLVLPALVGLVGQGVVAVILANAVLALDVGKVRSNPSPSMEPWLLVFEVRPSVLPES
ncbi:MULTISPECIES: hypothetical protein [unclassified Streptomyces]|uniref:hypothetical protein n=1 Tax=unclassified Streptomyces TaxID=2593676 RepID=UPI002254FC39|nr:MULTISPECIES: hypothetical protein [unclassified Streptomyces]MCX4864214.1 hypothetical protein [Streptomyces sp. NBC_00906]MCX4895452.1 hypothetical protein [Streptomyces sp. NBC_00892]